jgi:hypothetical protein
MVACPRCKHSNFDGFAHCSKCGTPLAAGGSGPNAPGGGSGGVRVGGSAMAAGGGGIDEYQRMMADRAAKQKRNRMIFAALAIVVVGSVAAVMKINHNKKNAAQLVLDAGGRFAERDKVEMGPFWNCVMSSEVDVGNFKGLDEIQMRIESAYFTQQKTFSDHLTSECVPKIEAARSAMGSMAGDMPAGMKEAFDKYMATMPQLQAGIEAYAEKVKGRKATKDVDGSIQEVGAAFSTEPSVESTAFEKFLVCAIPDLDQKKDIQAVLEFLASTCKTDAVKFMTHVREACGPLIQNLNKDAKPAPSKTFKANAKKFYEEDQRQLQAWEYCGKRSRKGKKVLDLEQFLTAAGEHIEARANMKMATLETAAKNPGEPFEAGKKKPAPGEAPAP